MRDHSAMSWNIEVTMVGGSNNVSISDSDFDLIRGR